MAAFRVMVTDDRYGSYVEEQKVLKAIGATVEVYNLSEDVQAIEVLRNADGILVNLYPLPARVIEALERCKVISRYGVG